MKHKRTTISARAIAVVIAAASLAGIAGCDSYVGDIEVPNSTIDEALLNSKTQVQFQITGVRSKFAMSHSVVTTISGLVSDELDFGGPDATFPQYLEIDRKITSVLNAEVEDFNITIGQLRLLADLLVDRVTNKIDFSDPATGKVPSQDSALKESALFTGYLYGGVARFWTAAYLGLEPKKGGGAIDAGPFIPSAQMYDLAIEKWKLALQHTASGYLKRVVNTLIARAYLFNGNYALAGTHAAEGLTAGDPDFQSLFTNTDNGSNGYWFFYAGLGRTQMIPAPRFTGYVTENPAEANRVLLMPSPKNPAVNIQGRYPAQNSPIPLVTWQENRLMQAEVELLGNNNPNAALGHVNAGRSSHDLAPLESLSKDALITERDKELSFTGNRVIDQNRFDLWDASLPAGFWHYIPLSKTERDANPNF